VCHRNNTRKQKLGDEVAKPDRRWLRQSNLADGDEPADSGEQNPQSKEVDEGSLAPDGSGRLTAMSGAASMQTVIRLARRWRRCWVLMSHRPYARPDPISISTVITSRPPDSNAASRACTSSRTARRLDSGSAQ
jgi:hypothetical protein